jgi:DNA polymerase III subunit alpha
MTHPLANALSVRSSFSIGESTLSVEGAVANAVELGYGSIALVDTMSVAGLPDLFDAAKKKGIKPIIGCTLRVYDDATYRPPKKGEVGIVKNNPEVRIKVYVKNENGLAQLFRLLSESSDDKHFYFNARVDMGMIKRHLKSSDVAVSTGDFLNLFHHSDHISLAAQFAALFDDFYVEIPVINTPLFDTLNRTASQWIEAYASARTLVTFPVLYTKGGADSADVMRAITSNAKMSDPWLSRPFIRDFEMKSPTENLDAIMALISRGCVSSATVKDAVRNTVAFAASPFFVFEKMTPCLPVMAPDEFAALMSEVRSGWIRRFSAPVLGHSPGSKDMPVYKQRLAYELDTLKKMGFSGYFLLVQQIVRWSKDNGIVVGPGRGSVGGSLVAYLMGITDVDPIRFDLLFERFINPSRVDLPDADLDFMSTRRSEVITYIENTFGHDRVAGISNYTTLGAASALRDVARVHGMSPFDYACSKQVEKEHGVSLSLDESAASVPDIERFKSKYPDVWKHATRLEGTVRGYGRHAAGIVVANEPVANRAPLETRSGQQVVAWDKRTVESWGLIKIDILGLTTLDILAVGAGYVKERHGKHIDYLKLPLDDKKVLAAFAAADTVGIFQFESGGMKRILKELGLSGTLSFEDLVATTALFRPGPLDAGLCDQYVQIKKGDRLVSYDHPSMENALKSTLGVLIYQEQVMQLCRDVAGFTMVEADNVRKAMGKKDAAKMAEYEEKFVEGAVKVSAMHKIYAESLWETIEGFAAYAFNRSHSVEYSVISWWAMWLKTYYPAEFYAAALSVVENDDKLAPLVMDARLKGIDVLPPDINESTNRIEVRSEAELVAPFQALKGISEASAKAIVELREAEGGRFRDMAHIEDAITRHKAGRAFNSRARERLDLVGGMHSIGSGSAGPLDPDRLKDRLEFLPGYTVDAVKADRPLLSDPVAMSAVIKIHEESKACEECSLKGTRHPQPRMGRTPKFMVVFDCPSFQEEKAGKLLEGDGATYIKAALKDAGLSANDGYWTALVKAAKPRGVKMLSNEQINGCSFHLLKEIEALKPPIIVAMGSNAIRFFAPEFKGSPSELVGKVKFDNKLDASIVFGINPQQVAFDASKASLLQSLCTTISSLIP